MKIEEANNGMLRIDCLDCGKLYEIEDFRNEYCPEVMQAHYEKFRVCPECVRAKEEAETKAQEEAKRAELLRRLPENIAKAGIPENYSHDRETGALFSEPPVRFAAEWIWKHRQENLLLSGITGSGKSTSACFVAARLIAEEKTVHYTSLRKLLSDWREAKTSDQSYAAEKLLRSIFRHDIYLIDEVVGKARVSESGQEMLFELLEAVNCGECHARLWLMGNFYSGSIEELFSDPEPVRRRLQENFACVLIDRKAQAMKSLQVWKEHDHAFNTEK